VTRHVLIFSLGPVQGFIAEARRAADLYAGSRMLSELAQAAARAIGGELILPHSLDSSDTPNKLTVIVTDPRSAAQAAETAARECWQGLAQAALGEDRLPQGGDFNDIWQRQLERHLEFTWAAAEIQGDNYIQAYRDAANALDARKRTRTFAQSQEDGPKDSLSGRRSAMREKIAMRDVKAYWKQVADRHPTKVKADEYLDALGVMKRFFEPRQPFPSVSTVAASGFLARVDKPEFETLLRDLKEKIQALGLYETHNSGFDFWPYDGDTLFAETYTPQRLKNSYHLEQADPRPALAALERLYKAAGSRPSPYYAILRMDGDQMGKHLSDCRNEQVHRKLSARLARFTQQVRDLFAVKPPLGYLIYAGGDDVLALLPLDSVLTVTDKIEQAYRDAFQGWPNEALPLNEDGQRIPFTISAGIAIVHHLYPLDAALEAAREAEHAAKNAYGRNAVCVALLKRSGEPLQVGGKWCIDDLESGTLGLVADVKEHFAKKRLSSKFAYEVAAEAQVVSGIEGAAQPTLKRLLERHKTDALRKVELDDLLQSLPVWAGAHNDVAPKIIHRQPDCREKKDETPQGLAELGRWLVLARFIAQEETNDHSTAD